MRRITKILFLLAASCLIGVVVTSLNAQRRAKPFSHKTPAHKNGKYADCSICHKLPSSNWQLPRRDGQAPFPDITNFPNPHGAGNAAVCVSCHARDVYTDGGLFCGTCHTVASMRATGGRGVLPYPVRGRARQFGTIFPHDVHQDLIAVNDRKLQFAIAHYVPAAYGLDDKVRPEFYNCAICHKTTSKMPKFQVRKLTGFKTLADIAPDTFDRPVTASFFKDSPDSHASCFSCHYQYRNLSPGKRSCAGCHELTTPFVERRATERYSIKFDHDRDGHGDKDCTSCHLRITQQSNIALMKDADVPIAACKECHAKQEEGFRRIILTEVERREESLAKNERPLFQCIYCHTSAIGRLETPPSHK